MTPVLSILIPTYNRASLVLEQLNTLAKANVDWWDGSIEIIVSDNWSETPVAPLPELISQTLPVQVVMPPQHLPTTEEHLAYGWGRAKGRFVWALGDDDVPVVRNLPMLLARCKQNDLDVMVWNCMRIGNDGRPLRASEVSACGSETYLSVTDFLERAGFWWIGAAISIWVIRRDLIKAEEAQTWVASCRCPIYSHSTYLLGALRQASLAFLNFPLVEYRYSKYDDGGDGAWERYSIRANQPRYFPWTVGFIDQLERLRQAGAIDYRYLGRVMDQLHGGQRFLLYQSIAWHLLLQLALGLRVDAQRLKREDVDLCLNWLWQAAPEHADIWHACSETSQVSWTSSRRGRKLQSHALESHMRNWEHMRTNHAYWSRFQHVDSHWECYDTALGYIAVPTDRPHLIALALAGIEVPSHPLILHGDSIDELAKRIALAGTKVESFNPRFVERPTSNRYKDRIRFFARFLPAGVKRKIRMMLSSLN